MRDGQLSLNNEVAGVLLATVDKCRDGLRLLEANGNDTGLDSESVVRQLLALSQDESATANGQLTNAVSQAPPLAVGDPSFARAEISDSRSLAVPQVTSAKPNSTAVETSMSDKNGVSAGDSTIRVDVALLDKLMTRVGELVLARNQIMQHTNRLEDAEFVSTAQRLNLITTELQEGVMKTRMQPIGNVWARKFPRVSCGIFRRTAWANKCASKWKVRKRNSTRQLSKQSKIL